jgi:UDP-glucose 4-epimerase
MSDRTLLIGGGGFIGSWLAGVLIDSGREVTVLGRSAVPSNSFRTPVRYISGNFHDTSLLRNLLGEHDEAVYLAHATAPNTKLEDPLQDLLQNLPAAVSLFSEASAARLRRLVIVSSGGTVYGEAYGTPITESHPNLPISPYGITKLTIENYARWFHITHGLPVICLRPANAYGEGQVPFRGQGFVATTIASIIEGRPITIFGDQGTVRDYIHVSDIAMATLDVLNHGNEGEAYNVGTGVGLSNIDVIEAVDRLAATEGLHSRIIWGAARSTDVQTNILDSTRLTNLTGWRPRITFENGLERTWRWYLNEYRQ